jgi:hypothetical protein
MTIPAAVVLEWVKEAGAYAYQREAESFAPAHRLAEPDAPPALLVDVLVGGLSVAIRARRGDRRDFRCLTWGEIERGKHAANPLLALIDETVAAVGPQS